MASRCDHFWCKIVWCSAGCESPQIWGNYRGDEPLIRELSGFSESWSELLNTSSLGPFGAFLFSAMSTEVSPSASEGEGESWDLIFHLQKMIPPSCPCAKNAAATSLAHCHLCQAHVSEFDVAEPDMDSEKLCCQVKTSQRKYFMEMNCC